MSGGSANKSNGRPLVTIVTVSFNAEKYIEDTVASVLAQTYPNIEYIIIDGGSTDGTLDTVRRHEDKISYWISEPDNGLYNAMNKGIALAQGDIISLLNADDVFYMDAVEMAVEALNRHAQAGFTCGPVDLADPSGRVIGRMDPIGSQALRARMYKEMPFPHQSMFVCRSAYEEIGTFDERYRLSADYDFLLRALEAEIPFTRLPRPVGFFREGGRSGGVKTFIETSKVLEAHGVNPTKAKAWLLKVLCKLALRSMMPGWLYIKLKHLRESSTTQFFVRGDDGARR